MERTLTGECLVPEDSVWLFPLIEGSKENLPRGGPPGWKASSRTADALGFEWVGSGAVLSATGGAWRDRNYRRTYRPPRFKPRLGVAQANLEWRSDGRGVPTSNAHIDIDENCP